MLLDKFNLSNRCALITGGAGLLGLQHAASLLELNASVIILSLIHI